MAILISGYEDVTDSKMGYNTGELLMRERNAHSLRSNIIDPHAGIRMYSNWQRKITSLCSAEIQTGVAFHSTKYTVYNFLMIHRNVSNNTTVGGMHKAERN